MSNSVPCYGIVNYFGDGWTVYYRHKKTEDGYTTGSLSGYGDFPFDEFPNIPVIDYSGSSGILFIKGNIVCEDVWGTKFDLGIRIWDYLPLDQFIQWHIDHGVKVIKAEG